MKPAPEEIELEQMLRTYYEFPTPPNASKAIDGLRKALVASKEECRDAWRVCDSYANTFSEKELLDTILPRRWNRNISNRDLVRAILEPIRPLGGKHR